MLGHPIKYAVLIELRSSRLLRYPLWSSSPTSGVLAVVNWFYRRPEEPEFLPPRFPACKTYSHLLSTECIVQVYQLPLSYTFGVHE